MAITVFMYHRILPYRHPEAVDCDLFSRQLEYLKKHFRMLSPDELSAALSAQSAPAHDISSLWKTLPASFHQMKISQSLRSSPERALRLESAERAIGTGLAFRETTAFFFAHRDGETISPRSSFPPPRRKT